MSKEKRVLSILPAETLTRRYTDIKGASRYMSISENTLSYLVKELRIPFCRVGRLIRFDLNEIDEFMKNKAVPVSMTRERGRLNCNA